MPNDSVEQQFFAREQWTIELVARETHTTVEEVQELFLIEYAKLETGAHIKSYLSLLTSNSVRCILNAQNAAKHGVAGI